MPVQHSYLVLGLYHKKWSPIVRHSDLSTAGATLQRLLNTGEANSYIIVTEEVWKVYVTLRERIDAL